MALAHAPKRILKRGLNGLGLDVRRTAVPGTAPRSASGAPPGPAPAPKADAYALCLKTLLATAPRLRVAQVGANDGRINDPLHDFVASEPERLDVLLIEPLADLIPHLEANYAFHPGPKIFNGAVGAPGELVLHTVDPAYWSRLKPIRYAAGWPDYRAPTGITSANRAHVVGWLQKHLKDPGEAEAATVARRVPSVDLPGAIAQTGFPGTPDVLQVDAEGLDDEVLYHCALETLQPRLIRFEACHLPEERADALFAHLGALGYEAMRDGFDSIAVRSRAAA